MPCPAPSAPPAPFLPTGRAEWLDKSKRQCLVLWKKVGGRGRGGPGGAAAAREQCSSGCGAKVPCMHACMHAWRTVRLRTAHWRRPACAPRRAALRLLQLWACWPLPCARTVRSTPHTQAATPRLLLVPIVSPAHCRHRHHVAHARIACGGRWTSGLRSCTALPRRTACQTPS